MLSEESYEGILYDLNNRGLNVEWKTSMPPTETAPRVSP